MSLRHAVVGTAALLAAGLACAEAGAFNVGPNCNGFPRGPSVFNNSYRIHTNVTGYPRQAMLGAFEAWNEALAGVHNVQDSGYTTSSPFVSGDGWSDFSLTTQAALGGTRIGLTTPKWGGSNNCYINESDTQIASDLYYAMPSIYEGYFNQYFDIVALHEIGHGLGLSPGDPLHSTNFSVMNAAPWGPTVGRFRGDGTSPNYFDATFDSGWRAAEPSPDDMQGLAAIYALPARRNLVKAATMSNPQGSVGQPNQQLVEYARTINVCRGQSGIPLNESTFNQNVAGETGIADRTFIRGPAGGSVTTHDVQVYYGGTYPGVTNYQGVLTMRIPCAATPGTYTIFHEIDSTATLPSSSWKDDIASNGLTLNVQTCGTCVGP